MTKIAGIQVDIIINNCKNKLIKVKNNCQLFRHRRKNNLCISLHYFFLFTILYNIKNMMNMNIFPNSFFNNKYY